MSSRQQPGEGSSRGYSKRDRKISSVLLESGEEEQEGPLGEEAQSPELDQSSSKRRRVQPPRASSRAAATEAAALGTAAATEAARVAGDLAALSRKLRKDLNLSENYPAPAPAPIGPSALEYTEESYNSRITGFETTHGIVIGEKPTFSKTVKGRVVTPGGFKRATSLLDCTIANDLLASARAAAGGDLQAYDAGLTLLDDDDDELIIIEPPDELNCAWDQIYAALAQEHASGGGAGGAPNTGVASAAANALPGVASAAVAANAVIPALLTGITGHGLDQIALAQLCDPSRMSEVRALAGREVDHLLGLGIRSFTYSHWPYFHFKYTDAFKGMIYNLRVEYIPRLDAIFTELQESLDGQMVADIVARAIARAVAQEEVGLEAQEEVGLEEVGSEVEEEVGWEVEVGSEVEEEVGLEAQEEVGLGNYLTLARLVGLVEDVTQLLLKLADVVIDKVNQLIEANPRVSGGTLAPIGGLASEAATNAVVRPSSLVLNGRIYARMQRFQNRLLPRNWVPGTLI